jgi:hypothetical protein
VLAAEDKRRASGDIDSARRVQEVEDRKATGGELG